MAIDDSLSLTTNSLVLDNKKLYPIRIDIGHWQLRHYISSPEPHILYYAAKEHVFSFNTKTQIRDHITALHFPARCFAAAHGFIVVGGGDHGSFAIIKLDGSPPLAAEVDALLPVDLGQRPVRNPASPTPRVRYDNLGEEIVNSISIHKLVNRDEPAVADEVVAVITNNDKTVRVYSLTQERQISVMELKFSANHATISPCGELLVAVGDYQEAYFFQRVNIDSSELKPRPGKYAASVCTWEPLSIVVLHVLRPALIAGYFSTAWSPDSRLCAVASECGYITVFDVEALKEMDEGEDAIIAIIPSTRPDAQPHPGAPGAVRSMLFSPPPWDLLVWAEDQGRVCVADLRAGLRVRQVLHLDPHESGLEKVEIALNTSTFTGFAGDHHSLADIQSHSEAVRSYGSPSHASYDSLESNTLDLTTNYLEFATERRRAQRLANSLTGESDSAYSSLTPQERQVMEALHIRSSRSERSATPRSIQYAPSELSGERHGSNFASSMLPSLPSYAGDFPALTRTNATDSSVERNQMRILHEYMRQRSGTLAETTASRMAEPLLNPMTNSIADLSSSLESTSGRSSNVASTHPRHPPMPPHLRGTRSRNPSNPGNADNMGSAVPMTGPAAGRSSPPPLNIESNPDVLEARRRRQLQQLQRARERVMHRDSPLGRYQQSLLNSRRHMTGHPDPNCGPQTAGLAISPDGRTLWCAAECGIWQFEINLPGRMCFPAETMR